MAKVKKEFYQKPTIKVVEFDLNKAICNNVATMSTCLKIDQETGNYNHTKFNPRGNSDKWKDWPGVSE